MVAHHINKDWENYLNFHVYLPSEKIDELLEQSYFHTILKDEVVAWLQENVGYTRVSNWHKHEWYPQKPKWMFKPDGYRDYRTKKFNHCVKFLDEEDAFAFTLTWL